MSQIILRESRGVLVTLEEGGLVRKTVRGLNKSKGSKVIPPKEMVDREIQALRLLEGVQGIQRFVKRESDNTFYTVYVPGGSLLESSKNLSQEYFDKLSGIVKDYQSKGVYRLSQSRRDFLINNQGNPVVIDFGNVLFKDDPIARIPGLVFLAKMYSLFRIRDLRKKYVSQNGFKLFHSSR